MTLFQKFLDLPHATLAFYATIILTAIAYIQGTITYLDAIGAVSAGAAGAGILGVARNGAGHGVNKVGK